MKKKIWRLLLIVLIIGLTACGKNERIDDAVDKFNNCETVKSYKKYGYKYKAEIKNDVIQITSVIEKKKTTLYFKIDGDVISNEKISNENLMVALLLIDSVGQTYGYKDGELAKNINSFPDEVSKYTLAKEGFEFKTGEKTTSIKIDVSKKIPLIDLNKYYLKTDDLDMIKQTIADKENGNQNGKSGNIAYDIFVETDETTIKIGQEEKLGDSAYKSILSAIEVVYGKKVADHFKEIYPKFIDGKKRVEAFTIETNYDVEDKEESVFKDTEVVLVTINNKKIK